MAERTDLFSADVIAGVLNLDKRRVQQLAAEGYLPKAEHGRYPLVGCVHGYIRYLKELANKAQRGTEQARLVRAQATKVEMENMRRAAELIFADQSQETLNMIAAQLGAQLDAIAGRLANECAGRDAAYIRQRLLDEHRSVRTALAELLEKRADALEALPDSGDDPAPAEAAQPEPVG